MKKFVSALLIIFCIRAQAFAYNYDPKFKREFYDEFIANYFQALQESLIREGFKQNPTYEYVATLRARLNRTDLEKTTWGCVSKYSPEQMKKSKDFTEKCFGDWSYKFMFEKNADTIQILKR